MTMFQLETFKLCRYSSNNNSIPVSLFVFQLFVISCCSNGAIAIMCVSDCTSIPDGSYHSCEKIGTGLECRVYITCTNSIGYDSLSCPSKTQWDDSVKLCIPDSTTCDDEFIVQLSIQGATKIPTTQDSVSITQKLASQRLTTDYVLITEELTSQPLTKETISDFSSTASTHNTDKLTTSYTMQTSTLVMSTYKDATAAHSTYSSLITGKDVTTTSNLIENITSPYDYTFSTSSQPNKIQLSQCHTVPTWQGLRFNVLGMSVVSDALVARYRCQTGYRFIDNNRVLYRVIKCNRSGVWAPQFVPCQAIETSLIDKSFSETVEAENAVYIAVAAVVFLVCEALLLVAMDLQLCWRQLRGCVGKRQKYNIKHC